MSPEIHIGVKLRVVSLVRSLLKSSPESRPAVGREIATLIASFCIMNHFLFDPFIILQTFPIYSSRQISYPIIIIDEKMISISAERSEHLLSPIKSGQLIELIAGYIVLYVPQFNARDLMANDPWILISGKGKKKRNAEARVGLAVERASGQREPLFQRRRE